jgi:hypothetical protein
MWNYFTHDQARSRAYRWGEDGLGGLSDDTQRLCFALALWNERDPILKERLYGLTNSESPSDKRNHSIKPPKIGTLCRGDPYDRPSGGRI